MQIEKLYPKYKKLITTVGDTTFLHNGGGSEIVVYITSSGGSIPSDNAKGILLYKGKDYVVIPADKDVYAKSVSDTQIAFGTDFSFNFGGGNGAGVTERVATLEAQMLMVLSRIGALEQLTGNIATLNNVLQNSGEQQINTSESRIALSKYDDYYGHKDNATLFSYDEITNTFTFNAGNFGFSKNYTFSNSANVDRTVTVRTKVVGVGTLIKEETYTVPNGQGTVEGTLTVNRDFSYPVTSTTQVETTIQCSGAGVILKKAVVAVVGK